MTKKEMNLLNRIPKKYRKYIVSLTIEKSNDYNERGQRLNNYTLEWDNGDKYTFQSQDMMIWLLKEYTIDGYYIPA